MPSEIEKELIGRLTKIMEKSSLQSYMKPSNMRTIFTFAHIWAGIIGSFFLINLIDHQTLYLKWLLFPLVIFYVGTRLNALGSQTHEASHFLILTNKKLNDIFINIFGGYWILNDVHSYRKVHNKHHTYLNQPEDPDLDLFTIPPGIRNKVKRFFRDLFFITAFLRICKYLKSSPYSKEHRGGYYHLILKICCQLIICQYFVLSYGLLKGGLYFFSFWVIPLFGVFPLIITLRITSEHYSKSNRSGNFVARTTLANPIEAYLFGANMEYHFEHHLLPSIPHYQLARLHNDIEAKGFFDNMPIKREDAINTSYIGFGLKLLKEDN